MLDEALQLTTQLQDEVDEVDDLQHHEQHEHHEQLQDDETLRHEVIQAVHQEIIHHDEEVEQVQHDLIQQTLLQ